MYALERAPSRGDGDVTRELCAVCLRPSGACYCRWIEPIDTRTRVLILQHPRERRVPVNTARIAHLALRNSDLRIGIDFTADEVVQEALSGGDAVLLFPGEEAADVRQRAQSTRMTLVVIDGTWSQASKLIAANPGLRGLPRIALHPGAPSEYRIRRQPQPLCLSTIEALATILGELEGSDAATESLLVPFRHMVEHQIAHGTVGAGRGKRKKEERQPLPAELGARARDVVIVCGEANTWSRSSHGPPPEIVQWVAVRPETGERFEAFIRPRSPLAPSCPQHLEVEPEQILDGESVDDFARRWGEFIGEHSIVVTWGGFAGDVLEREGVRVGERCDLRLPTLRHLGSRAGALEVCVRALGAQLPEPRGSGRAGRRLAELEAVYAALRVERA